MNDQKVKEEKLRALKEKMSKQEALEKVFHESKKFLTQKANQRLANIQLVDSKKALTVAQTIAYGAKTGQFPTPINDEQLKVLLQRLSGKREITIKRK